MAITRQTLSMSRTGQRVIPYDLGVRWDPNGSDPLLVQEGDRAMLVVGCHFDDPDKRLVVVDLHGCSGVWLAGPNDEARSGHRLWTNGLSDCLWSGEVVESSWIAQEMSVNSVHPRHDPERYADLRHWILLFKEKTAECIGTSIGVLRRTPEELSAAQGQNMGRR